MDIASQINDSDRSFAMPQSPFRRGISAVAGLGSSLLSAAFNHKLAEKSAKAHYDRQLSFWEKQNTYNHPAAVRRRLEAAGFNAAAASGQIAGNNQAGGLSSVPGNEYAQGGVFQQETFSEALRMFAELRSVNLDNENTRRQIQLSYLEELLKKGELAGVELSNQEKSTMLRYLDEAQESNLKLMFEELRNRQNDNHRKEADNAAYDEYRAAGGNQYIEQRALLQSQINYTDAQRQTIDAVRHSEVALAELRVEAQRLSNSLEQRFGAVERNASLRDLNAKWQLMRQEFQSNNLLLPLQRALMQANVSQADANSLISLAQSMAASWDAEFLQSLVGNDGDFYDIIGRLIYEIVTDLPFSAGANISGSGSAPVGTPGYTVNF